MTRFYFAVILAVVLSSCGFDKAPPASTGDEGLKPMSGNQEQRVGNQELPAVADHVALFADKLVEKGPGMFRFDRIRDARDGGQERQVFIEMLGANDIEAADLSAELLETMGFVPGNRFGDENGIRLSYALEGEGAVRVLVRTRKAHSKLTNEAATSSVYLTQPAANP